MVFEVIGAYIIHRFHSHKAFYLQSVHSYRFIRLPLFLFTGPRIDLKRPQRRAERNVQVSDEREVFKVHFSDCKLSFSGFSLLRGTEIQKLLFKVPSSGLDLPFYWVLKCG
jgi:hypothetical protein